MVWLMVGGGLQPAGLADGGGDRGPAPMADGDPWYDPLDDTSALYLPGGGLAGIEVSGGSAHLAAGETTGWLASEVITCPPGYRYDLVQLDIETPGNSEVHISVLNASADPVEVGFANDTVPGFRLKAVSEAEPYVNVYSINHRFYDRVRLQVNLDADGTDRPRLLSWTLRFIDVETWRDDFLWAGKMEKRYGLNMTGNTLEVNLSRGGSMTGGDIDFDPYPPVFFPGGGGSSSSAVFYPDAGLTTYDDADSFNYDGLNRAIFADLNGDSNLDMICANGGGYDSEILWGDGTTTWTDDDATQLNVDNGNRVAFGDVNGDGMPDLVFAATGPTGSCVFLNNGNGNFSHQPDVVFTGKTYPYLDTGDLNNDGIDDIVFNAGNTCEIYFGGEDGPDTTMDLTMSRGGSSNYGVLVDDLNGDGYEDVSFGGEVIQKLPIYWGSESGWDTTVDLELDVTSYSTRPEVGDLNGDGMLDLVVSAGPGGGYGLWIFKGTASGWNDQNVVKLPYGGGWANHLAIVDVDRDGYDDVLCPRSTDFHVYYGGTQWPTGPDVVKSGATNSQISVAVPSGVTGGLSGGFVTEDINLPARKKWDVLYLDAFLPQNTSFKMSVLDVGGSPIEGYSDLQDLDVDISGIKTSSHRTIKVKVSVATEFNNTTPVLDSLMVKWQDEGTWRDEFFGPAKVARSPGLEAAARRLSSLGGRGGAPQLIFPSIRGDGGYMTLPTAFIDGGGLDYTSLPPLTLNTRGTSAAATADLDGDGYADVVLAVHRTSDTAFGSKSPLFMGTPMGMRATPDHEFPTTGASDVLLQDIDGDGYLDVVFAQELKGVDDHAVNSTLFWGSAEGFSDKPDLEFATRGATGVVAADLDGDDDLDLAFSCYRATSTVTESMVFLQEATGFNGSSPSHELPTRGARAVAAGDIDGDDHVDLVFANSIHQGFAEIASFVYWGKTGGGYETIPAQVTTSGAEDVLVADLDGDDDPDLVFANQWDDSLDREIDSFVYLLDGSRTLPSSPSFRLPTTGATGVAVADLDGTGWMDIILSCGSDGITRAVPSLVYLGTASGWPATPDITLPTEGAQDVVVATLLEPDAGGYLSKPIVPEDERNTGTYHTLRYTAALGTGETCTLRFVDTDTWEVLAETPALAGTHEWDLQDLWRVKEHPRVRVMAIFGGLDTPGDAYLADLWVNWTVRVKLPPRLLDTGLGTDEAYRGTPVPLWVNVSDEYDLPEELDVLVQHRLNGTSAWDTYLLDELTFSDGSWRTVLLPRFDAAVGVYDLRVSVTDSDGLYTPWVMYPAALTVLNNLPTAPVVTIDPASPLSTSTMIVSIVKTATDAESPGLVYRYRWSRDGEMMANLTTDSVPYFHTTKGENWSVEVRAFDGLDEGPPALAWALVANAPPVVLADLPDPEFDEDTVDTDWLDLSGAFMDPDGDPIVWSLAEEPVNLTVDIDPVTGRVTLTPAENWYGSEDLVFIATDGEKQVSQRVTVTVRPVNDIPWIATVDGKPVTSGTLEYTIRQGDELVITYTLADVEGDDLVAQVTNPAVTYDEAAGTIRFSPQNDEVGTLTFTLRVNDVVSTDRKVTLDFVIVVENENDPMDVPRITSPANNSRYKVNQSFSLIAICDDPDIQFGQELNFSWSSNVSGLLGYGSSLVVQLAEPGTHLITLTVSDPDFSKTALITIIIEGQGGNGPPPPPPNGNGGDGDGVNWVLVVGIVVALVIVGVVLFIATRERRVEAQEVRMEEREDAEEARRAEEEARVAAEEARVAAATAAAATAAGWSTEEEEDLDMGASDRALSMKATVTGEASSDVKKLWSGIDETAAERTEEEREEMRRDNLKRKYQNAIGRLPYGIPSKELAGMDWVELSNLLATGEKRTVEGGAEVTQVNGRWYHSDADDTGTFLKEHGRKEEPKGATAKGAPSLTNEEMLRKLEERFVLGEISEETYYALKKKYE